jgi:transposase
MTKNVEIGLPQRRRWTPAEKLQIVEQSLASDASVNEVARRHSINPGMLHRWRHEARTGTLPRTPESKAQFALVAVAGASDHCGAIMVEVVLRNGRVLRLPEIAMPARAAQLADALEGCRS